MSSWRCHGHDCELVVPRQQVISGHGRASACTTTMRSIRLLILLSHCFLGVSASAGLSGGATCPVPFTTQDSCPVCSSKPDCVQLTQNLESSCYKGVDFLAGTTVKSYHCTFVGPAEIAAAVSPGAYIQCSPGSSSGVWKSRDSAPSCILGLVVSASLIRCEARPCIAQPHSPRVDCKELQCQCLSSCSSDNAATQILALSGKLAWECQTKGAQPASRSKPANCTLAVAGLPWGAAQAVCDVGECIVRGEVEEAAVEGTDATQDFKRTLDNNEAPPERNLGKGLELSGAATCPLVGPFGSQDSCLVCSNKPECVQLTGMFESTCYKGFDFIAESQTKSYRCNFVGPAAFAAAVSPGAYIQCSTGIGNEDGDKRAGGPSCIMGLAVSGSSVLCEARQCATEVNSSRVDCKEMECQCFPSCSNDTAASQLLALSGQLVWECKKQDAEPVSGNKLSNCTLAVAGLPGGAAKAVCNVGECIVQGLVQDGPIEGTENLLAFKSSLDNGDEALPDWSLESASPCEWEGIACDIRDRIVTINLANKGLVGSIPFPDGWALPSTLLELDLGNNSLRGQLPPGWVPPRLPAGLIRLAVPYLQLSGTISSEWAFALPSELFSLDLAWNQLRGTIPDNWTLPSGLGFLSLTGNHLTGSIPADWGLPSSLTRLALSSNKLTGWAIPPELSLPERLEWLEVENNNISGPAKQFRALPPNLVFLLASNNSITGSIVGDWALPPGLRALALGHNRLTGSIPVTLELPPSMNRPPNIGIPIKGSPRIYGDIANLVLEGNLLTGTLPTWPDLADANVSVKPGNPGLCGKVPLTPHYVGKMKMSDFVTYNHELLESLPSCDSVNTPEADEVSNGITSTGSAGKTAALVGGVVGGCVVVAMAGCAVWLRRRRRGMHTSRAEGPRTSDEEKQEEQEQAAPNVPPGSQHADPTPGPRLPLDRSLRSPVKPSPFKGYSPPLGSLAGSSTQATDALEALQTPTAVSTGPGRHFVSSTDEGAASRRSASTAAMSQLLGSDPLLATIVGRLKVSSRGSSSAPSSALAEMSFGMSPPGSVGQLETRAMPNPAAGARQAPGNRPGRQGGHLVDVEIWLLDFLDLQLTKQIGWGSFGRVYMAHWNGIVVACKLLLGEAAKMGDVGKAAASVLSLSSSTLHNLRREAGLMAALRHPHVLGFIGLCTQPPCLVSEWCPRGSLYDVMRAAKTDPALAAELTWPVRLRMASEAAFGMVYLHNFRPPILHRDLKSNNLLLTETFSAKVGDFNLSKAMDQDASVASSAASFGNPRWMAPEVIAGDAHSFASDIYSFGIVLWEVLTMSLPWGSSSFWQVASDVSMGIRPPIPTPGELPPGVEESAGLDAYTGLMSRCWAHRAADRPTFAEVAAELRAIAEMDLAR